MRLSETTPMTARAERRAMIALLTAFALLVQAFVPSLAMAAASDGGVIICTQQGLQTAPEGPAQAPGGHTCQHCVCPAITATAASPIANVRAIAYFIAVAPVAPTPRGVRPPSRAPPRPPGQGPPTSNA